MIGRKSTTFLCKSLLVGLLQLKLARLLSLSHAGLTKCDFADCNVICSKSMGDGSDTEQEGLMLFDSAGQRFGCFAKGRPWKSEQRKKWDWEKLKQIL